MKCMFENISISIVLWHILLTYLFLFVHDIFLTKIINQWTVLHSCTIRHWFMCLVFVILKYVTNLKYLKLHYGLTIFLLWKIKVCRFHECDLASHICFGTVMQNLSRLRIIYLHNAVWLFMNLNNTL